MLGFEIVHMLAATSILIHIPFLLLSYMYVYTSNKYVLESIFHNPNWNIEFRIPIQNDE